MSRPLLPTELWAQTDAIEGCGKPHESRGTLAFCQTAINRPMIVFAVMTRWTELARAVVVAAAAFAALASASSSQNTTVGPASYSESPPPPQQMAPTAALGLWMSSFGAVKIEEDLSRGAAGSGNVHGAWTYQDRTTQREVIGYFTGTLRGNVLEFRWQEPSAQAPLVGRGFLAFDPSGRSFRGRWRTDAGDRVGDWDGWRSTGAAPQGSDPQQNNPYGQPQPYPPQNSPYGQPQPQPQPDPQPQPQPYPQQPYPPQSSPYGQPQPQPYPGQQPAQPYGQPQPYPQQQPYAQPPQPARPRYY